MRKIIAAMQMSVDGFIEGANGEVDWVDNWEDPFDILPEIDTCVLGRGMFAGYELYWRTIFANPEAVLPFTGRVATPGELRYARFADTIKHIVLSRTLERVSWHTTRIVRSIDDIRELKRQPGKHIHAVGGATLVSGLLTAGVVDELRVVVRPIVLGGGKAMFKDVAERHALTLSESKTLDGSKVRLNYTVGR